MNEEDVATSACEVIEIVDNKSPKINASSDKEHIPSRLKITFRKDQDALATCSIHDELFTEKPMSNYEKYLRAKLRIERARINQSGDLNLSNLQLTKLPKSLLSLNCLIDLDLSNNRIGDKGVKFLLGMSSKSSLNRINLQNNYISSEGAISFIHDNDFGSLTRLNFSSNLIGANTTGEIAKSTHLNNLTHLNISHCGIGADGMKALSEAKSLLSLTHLSTGGNGIGNDGVKALAHANFLSSLLYLGLSSNELGPSGMRYLAASKRLHFLNQLELSHNGFGNDGILALSEAQSLDCLTHLDLRNTRIGYSGLLSLLKTKYLSSLTHLDLGSNYINAHAVTALANEKNLNRLTHLNLRNNSVGPEGAKALSASKQLKSVIYLCLRYNTIGDDGARAIAESKQLNSLQALDLRDAALDFPVTTHNNLASLRLHCSIGNIETAVTVDQLNMYILGRYCAGKTTFARRLVDKKYQSESEKRTVGFNTYEYPINIINQQDKQSHTKEEIVNLRILDFGGQDIQKYCHGFILSKHGIYVLIIDSRTTKNTILDWLNVIKHYGATTGHRALIIPIKNIRGNLRETTEDVIWNTSEYQSLFKEYLKIEEPLCIDVKSDPRFHEICNERLKYALKSYSFPTVYPTVKQVHTIIREWPNNYVELSLYYNLLEYDARFLQLYNKLAIRITDTKIDLREFSNLVLAYLSQLGVIHHFEANEEKSDFIILKKSWLEKGIYGLLLPEQSELLDLFPDSIEAVNNLRSQLSLSNGKFKKDQLYKVWNHIFGESGSKAVTENEMLLRLMQRPKNQSGLNLIYPLKSSSEGEFLCPAYLPLWSPPVNSSMAKGESLGAYIRGKIESSFLCRVIQCEYLPPSVLLHYAVERHDDLITGDMFPHAQNRYFLRAQNLHNAFIEIFSSDNKVWIFLACDGSYSGQESIELDIIVEMIRSRAENLAINNCAVYVPCRQCYSTAVDVAMVGYIDYDDLKAEYNIDPSNSLSCKLLGADKSGRSKRCRTQVKELVTGIKVVEQPHYNPLLEPHVKTDVITTEHIQHCKVVLAIKVIHQNLNTHPFSKGAVPYAAGPEVAAKLADKKGIGAQISYKNIGRRTIEAHCKEWFQNTVVLNEIRKNLNYTSSDLRGRLGYEEKHKILVCLADSYLPDGNKIQDKTDNLLVTYQ